MLYEGKCSKNRHLKTHLIRINQLNGSYDWTLLLMAVGKAEKVKQHLRR